MKVRQLRTFVPSIDFNISEQFYLDMGFKVSWKGDDLIIFNADQYSFFLQNAYVKDWAENVMLQLFVDDLEGLYQVCEKLVENYDGTKIRPIFKADYGMTFHLIGPAGELWHMMQAE